MLPVCRFLPKSDAVHCGIWYTAEGSHCLPPLGQQNSSKVSFRFSSVCHGSVCSLGLVSGKAQSLGCVNGIKGLRVSFFSPPHLMLFLFSSWIFFLWMLNRTVWLFHPWQRTHHLSQMSLRMFHSLFISTEVATRLTGWNYVDLFYKVFLGPWVSFHHTAFVVVRCGKLVLCGSSGGPKHL